MAKTFRIVFTTKAAIGIAMYELNAFDIPRSNYEVSPVSLVIYYASADVVDVIKKSITSAMYRVEEE